MEGPAVWSVRCPNCGAKVGEWVVGVYVGRCRRCKARIVEANAGRATLTDGRGRRVTVTARVDPAGGRDGR